MLSILPLLCGSRVAVRVGGGVRARAPLAGIVGAKRSFAVRQQLGDRRNGRTMVVEARAGGYPRGLRSGHWRHAAWGLNGRARAGRGSLSLRGGMMVNQCCGRREGLRGFECWEGLRRREWATACTEVECGDDSRSSVRCKWLRDPPGGSRATLRPQRPHAGPGDYFRSLSLSLSLPPPLSLGGTSGLRDTWEGV